MNKELYIEEITKQLTSFYKQIHSGHRPSEAVRYRLSGFVDAGVFLKLITPQERDVILETVHQDIFGMSVAGRQQQSSNTWQGVSQDYSLYDTPTYDRVRKANS